MSSMKHDAVLGCVPRNEPRSPPHPSTVRAIERECRVFLRQLLRRLPAAPSNARLTVRSTQLPNGAFTREVVVRHDDSPLSRAYVELALRSCPEVWDREAVAELEWFAKYDQYRSEVQRGRIAESEVPVLYRSVLPPSTVHVVNPIAIVVPAVSACRGDLATGANVT
jgi:hypothetical protein